MSGLSKVVGSHLARIGKLHVIRAVFHQFHNIIDASHIMDGVNNDTICQVMAVVEQ